MPKATKSKSRRKATAKRFTGRRRSSWLVMLAVAAIVAIVGGYILVHQSHADVNYDPAVEDQGPAISATDFAANITQNSGISDGNFSAIWAHLCDSYGYGGCMEPKNGTFCLHCQVQVGGGNWRLGFYPDHRVCDGRKSDSNCLDSSGIGPFAGGSGLNTKYDGDRIWVIGWHAALAYCLSSKANYNYAISDENCANSNNQRFVSSGHWLINVGASNHAYHDCNQGCFDPTEFRAVLVNHDAGGCGELGTAYIKLDPSSSNCYNNWGQQQL